MAEGRRFDPFFLHDMSRAICRCPTRRSYAPVLVEHPRRVTMDSELPGAAPRLMASGTAGSSPVESASACSGLEKPLPRRHLSRGEARPGPVAQLVRAEN